MLKIGNKVLFIKKYPGTIAAIRKGSIEGLFLYLVEFDKEIEYKCWTKGNAKSIPEYEILKSNKWYYFCDMSDLQILNQPLEIE